MSGSVSYLRRQEVSPSFPWEVIVVDNASTDGTPDVARQSWPNDMPALLRMVHEPRPGLSHARNRGFSEAKYEIVSFIDDDNWVCPNWIQLVSGIMSRYPNMGACGGYTEAVCESTPPCWFESYK
jgi:glycosyltransferase involved in cell wall biosynthesis